MRPEILDSEGPALFKNLFKNFKKLELINHQTSLNYVKTTIYHTNSTLRTYIYNFITFE